MKQKFRRLTLVKVAEKMRSNMSHFDSGFIGIVCGTYSQLYGGKDFDSYCLYKVENDKIINRISWFNENQLKELPTQNRMKAEQLIDEYNSN